jgi:hypothetical protein
MIIAVVFMAMPSCKVANPDSTPQTITHKDILRFGLVQKQSVSYGCFETRHQEYSISSSMANLFSFKILSLAFLQKT